jgi:TolA protein
MSAVLFRLLGHSSGFMLAIGLHIGAFVVLAGDKSQHGVIESEVASVSINLQETKVLEDVVQGDIETRRASDLDQAAQTSKQGSEEEPKASKPEQEIEKQPESKPEPEPISTPEPEPIPEPQPDYEKLKQEALAKAEVEKKNRRKELIEKREQQRKQAEAIAKEREKAEADARRKAKAKKKAQAQAKAKEKAIKAAKASRRMAAAKKGSRRGQAKGSLSQSSGRRRASLGSVRAYAGRVQARVASHRPSGGGRGTVRVTFAISSAGRLRFARILRSSGNARLDRRALAAVRRASPFPKPPAGMTSRQLTFSMPFRFR